MQFVNPIWLWGILATAIPVIIHLWNTKPGRVLQVGSIALLEKTEGQSARNIKLRELLLLILRCLLIILLSIILTRPVFKTANDNKSKPWLVISKTDLQSAITNHKTQIDSLLKAGFELRNTDTLFSVYTLADSGKIAADNLLSGWDALRELNSQIPESTPAVIFSNLSMNNYRGDRPTLPPNLQWRPIVAEGDSLQWIQQAHQMPNDSLQLVWGNTNQGVTKFSSVIINSADLGGRDFTKSFDNGLFKIGWKPAEGNDVIVDTGMMRIVVVPGDNKTDATYLLAALRAIQAQSLKSLQLVVQNAGDPVSDANWIFWLSDVTPPQLGNGEKLLRYSANKLNPVNNLLARANGKPMATAIPIFQQAWEDSLLPVWEDGSGRVLLGSRGDEFIFTSRFNPAASGLVWNEAFPSLLIDLINEPSSAKFDLRTMNPEQANPVVSNFLTQSQGFLRQEFNNKHSENTRLYLGIFLMLVLILERVLSQRNHLLK